MDDSEHFRAHPDDSIRQLRRLGQRQRRESEEERLRIARWLHDEIGQTLTLLKKNAAWILANPNASPGIADRLQSSIQITDDTIRTVRLMTSELRPGVLDLGLAAALEWQAEEFQTRTGINCVLNLREEDDLAGTPAAIQIYRIFQQALDNIDRHAAATRVNISLCHRDGSLVLEIRDNGRGITDAQIANSESLGLLEMKERAFSVGAKLSVRGRPREGTTVIVSIPLAATESA